MRYAGKNHQLCLARTQQREHSGSTCRVLEIQQGDTGGAHHDIDDHRSRGDRVDAGPIIKVGDQPVTDTGTARSTGVTTPQKPRRGLLRRTWPLLLGALFLLVLAAPMILPAGVLFPPSPAQAITERDWQMIAKDPATSEGRRIVVYGRITQFDAATGRTGFRAEVRGTRFPVDEAYPDGTVNTLLDGSEADLGPLVEGDVFRAEATVTDATSYETQLGGRTVAPHLDVTAIQRSID